MINFKEKETTIDSVSNVKLTNGYKKICNRIAETVNQQLFDGTRSWYWIGEDGCEMCDFDDTDVLSIETMSCIIEKNVSYEEYVEWRDYFIDHPEIVTTNLRTWIKKKRNKQEEIRIEEMGQDWFKFTMPEYDDVSVKNEEYENSYLVGYCYDFGIDRTTTFDRIFVTIKGEMSIEIIKKIEYHLWLKKECEGKTNFSVLNVTKINKDGGKIINDGLFIKCKENEDKI